MKLIIRLLAFFGKELNEVRRQPRLLLSLLVGPFLILLLFGLGYRSQPPPLQIGLVVPEQLSSDPRIERVRRVLNQNFELVYEGNDPEPALQLLANGQLDIVEVLPANYADRVAAGEQATLRFVYNEINPQTEQFLKFSAYTQIDAINQVFVVESIQELQANTATVSARLEQAIATLEALEQSPEDRRSQAEAQQSITELRDTLDALAANPALGAAAFVSGSDGQDLGAQVTELNQNLEQLEQAIASEQITGQPETIEETRQQLEELQASLDRVSQVPPTVFISPLQEEYVNLQGQALDLMKYFAPGVAVLILQHIAVTLGALSLVREAYRGSFEFFRVAPVSILQVLFGKYLAYMVYVGLIAAALIGLMIWPLGVPFVGDPWIFVGLMALFLFASISVGFLISVVSNSDTQAVQLAMLVLLLSIFFSGFILPAENFVVPVRYVGYLVPMTPAMEGVQDLMLLGLPPEPAAWVVLSLLAILTFVLVVVFGYRQFRRPFR